MTILSQLRYGPVTPVLAAVMAAAGCLLGAMLTARGRRLTGRSRYRSLAYATAAVAGLALWLPQLLALLGLQGATVPPRFSVEWLAASLGGALVLTAAAVFVLGTGWLTRDRIVLSGVLLGLAAISMHLLGLRAVKLLGTLQLNPLTSTVGACAAIGVSVACVRLLVHLRAVRRVIATAIGVGVTIVVAHFASMSTVDVLVLAPGSRSGGIRPPQGLSAIQLLAPTVLLGIGVLFVLVFFTFGNSSRYSIMAIYDTSLDMDSSRVVAEITARLTEPVPEDDAEAWATKDSVTRALQEQAQYALAASEATATQRGRAMAAAVIARAAAITDAATLRADGTADEDALEAVQESTVDVVMRAGAVLSMEPESTADADLPAPTAPLDAAENPDVESAMNPPFTVSARAAVPVMLPNSPDPAPEPWPAFGRKEIWAPLAGYTTSPPLPSRASGLPPRGGAVLPPRPVSAPPAWPLVQAGAADPTGRRRRDPINRDRLNVDAASPVNREPVSPGKPRPRPSARPDWRNVPRWGDAAPIESPQSTNSMRYPPEPAAAAAATTGQAVAVVRKARRGNRGR